MLNGRESWRKDKIVHWWTYHKNERKYHTAVKHELFTDRQLKEMILPLLLEQFLMMLVGLADTFVISYAGEAAVSSS